MVSRIDATQTTPKAKDEPATKSSQKGPKINVTIGKAKTKLPTKTKFSEPIPKVPKSPKNAKSPKTKKSPNRKKSNSAINCKTSKLSDIDSVSNLSDDDEEKDIMTE